MVCASCNFSFRFVATFFPDVLLKSIGFLSLVMKVSQNFSPFTHAEIVGKLRSKISYTGGMFFIGLYNPMTSAVLVNV